MNQLTSSGLTVGAGTAANIISTFGSSLVGVGRIDVTVPTTDKALPSSPALGSFHTFNLQKYVTPSDPAVPLPSGGKYIYARESTSSTNSIPPSTSGIHRKLVLTSASDVVSGGYNLNPNAVYNGAYLRVGGGFVRVE